ncbi:hypothetical protein GCK32_019262 [Trichostrongylus colubriformis]|uniref:Saposin B-type domain-containing protein n=1 Tax=Trichostrongylus colubriformis TaxID=6319 RepID=A0AAN8FC17_TRICO
MKLHVLLLLVFCMVINVSAILSVKPFCKMCTMVIKDVHDLVTEGANIETAARQKCKEKTPKLMHSFCKILLSNVSKMEAQIKTESPKEVCSLLHLCKSSSSLALRPPTAEKGTQTDELIDEQTQDTINN